MTSGVRKVVTDTCNEITRQKPVSWWLEELEKASVGCSPIKNLKARHIFDTFSTRFQPISLPVLLLLSCLGEISSQEVFEDEHLKAPLGARPTDFMV